MDEQFINLAREIFKDVSKKYGSMKNLNSNSPFSEKNIDILQTKVKEWKKKCDNYFSTSDKKATESYWGGELKKEGKIGPWFFKKMTKDSKSIDILFKEGYHLATLIRKMLTGQNNKIRFLFNINKEYQELEFEEEQLFTGELDEFFKIENISNKGAINAKYSLKVKNQEMLLNTFTNNIKSDTNTAMLNYILNHSNKNLKKGRVYEAYYQALENRYNIDTSGGKRAITNLVRYRFKQDTIWGVQQVGDIQEKSGSSFNQVQLKAFLDGNQSANFGGLPSLITQMNRIDNILSKIKNKQNNLSQEILDIFYHDSIITDKMSDTLFNQSKKIVLEYIDNNLKLLTK